MQGFIYLEASHIYHMLTIKSFVDNMRLSIYNSIFYVKLDSISQLHEILAKLSFIH